MSRTKRSTRPVGYEYWSKRPGSNNHGSPPGPASKKETHRKERAQSKRIIMKEPREPEYDEREFVPGIDDENFGEKNETKLLCKL